jgi:hypothetical protein
MRRRGVWILGDGGKGDDQAEGEEETFRDGDVWEMHGGSFPDERVNGAVAC